MADFFQSGAIATLHRLGPTDVARLERELEEFSRERPIALVLPCHVDELGSHALNGIVRELSQVRYFQQIVIGIDGAKRKSDWLKARETFAAMPQQPVLLWNDGPRMKALYRKLDQADIHSGAPGKGRNVWICLGYVLAGGRARLVASHDCDIITYSRELPARLCYPVAHPTLGFDVCKGYSARYTTRLNGRVMRLLFTPFIRSLESILGPLPFLVFLDTFRYPLSGEICLDLDLARRVRMPSDWGLEVGMLAEIFRNTAARAICQSELSERYDHKHQDLSVRDSTKGLHRMAVDVSQTIFRVMASEGIKLDAGLFDTLLSAYERKAEETLRHYDADSLINGLTYARHDEEVAVNTFAHSIRAAAKAFLQNPPGTPLIPNWNRVESALPHFLGELSEAVGKDNAL